MFKTVTTSKNSDKPAQLRRACRRVPSSFLLSHHILSLIVTARPRWQKRFFAREPSRHCDKCTRRTQWLWAISTSTPHCFADRGHVAAQGYSSKIPILEKELDQSCPLTYMAWPTSQPQEVSLAEQERIHSGLIRLQCLWITFFWHTLSGRDVVWTCDNMRWHEWSNTTEETQLWSWSVLMKAACERQNAKLRLHMEAQALVPMLKMRVNGHFRHHTYLFPW